MKITPRMIDRELRAAGFVARLLVDYSSERKFRANQKMQARLMRGKKIRGVSCGEAWIRRKKDGSLLRVCVYKPSEPPGNVPGVLWMHGGGYGTGLPEMSAAMVKRLVSEGGCVVAAPDYRLSIDAPYPAALEDCHEALVWMKDHAAELGIRDDQLMVGGESAGGGLAAALSLYARDTGAVNIAFQMPLYPMIDDRMETESAKLNDAPVWNSDFNRIGWGLYLGELSGKNVPAYAAPARATDYSRLPPTVTFVGDLEPFRDETIAYAENLRKAGVPVEFRVYPGCYHAFDVVCPGARVSRDAVSFLMKSFRYAVEHHFAGQKRSGSAGMPLPS